MVTSAPRTKALRLTETDIVFRKHMAELDLHFATEWQFDDTRKWRADYMISKWHSIEKRALVEIEGGAFTRGRHTRGKGFIADLEKYNMAAALGWRVFRFTPQMVLRGEAKEFIRKWL